MNKYSKLLKNSGIFAIANVGSHFISFLLVRFYTELLTREQYGMIDVMVTTTSLVIPIVSLAVVEAVLRFSIDDDKPKDVFINGLFIAVCGSIAFAFIGPWIFIRTAYRNYFLYMVALVFLTSIDNICAQHVRGVGKVIVFAVAGIIKTGVLAGSNIFLLLGLGMKIEGYLLSLIISEIVSILFLILASKAYKGLSFRPNMPLMRQMTRYSIPLIPNSLSWWVMNAADKYAILLMLGASSNGLYAVAHKLPSLINICNNLFFQAWQLSAVEESKSETKAEFYSNVFNVLALTLFMVTAVLFILLRPIMKLLAAAEYSDAWNYTPFLIIGMVFAAFSSFLGTNYVAMKKTNGALKTTIVGAATNIVLNFLLIKLMGINGAALATMISFAITWIYRAIDTREYVYIEYKPIPLTCSIICLVGQAIMMISGFSYSIYTGLLVCLIIIVLYKNEFFTILKMGRMIIKQKNRNVFARYRK